MRFFKYLLKLTFLLEMKIFLCFFILFYCEMYVVFYVKEKNYFINIKCHYIYLNYIKKSIYLLKVFFEKSTKPIYRL